MSLSRFAADGGGTSEAGHVELTACEARRVWCTTHASVAL